MIFKSSLIQFLIPNSFSKKKELGEYLGNNSLSCIMQQTHLKVNNKICGTPLELKDGYSRVLLKTTSDMIVDNFNLIHGGFIFGLADFAAMIAINHPNVVLGGANVKFIKPTILGDEIIAEAKLIGINGKKQVVEVTVKQEDVLIFNGEFYCYVLDNHILKS